MLKGLIGMTFEEFDQTDGGGWRAQAHAGDCAGAAQAIEAYIAANPRLEDWQMRTLHFHAVQMWAWTGETARALGHIPGSLISDEAPDSPWRWNDYVAATEAFLRRDRAGLLAARERIRQGQGDGGPGAPNLQTVDRLIANFDRDYADAY